MWITTLNTFRLASYHKLDTIQRDGSILMYMSFQGKRTYAETYEAPPKAHAYTEPWFDAK